MHDGDLEHPVFHCEDLALFITGVEVTAILRADVFGDGASLVAIAVLEAFAAIVLLRKFVVVVPAVLNGGGDGDFNPVLCRGATGVDEHHEAITGAVVG